MIEDQIGHGDSLFGIQPDCGCVTAWMDLNRASGEDIQRFCLEMAADHRRVIRADLTGATREALGRCEHQGRN